MVWGAAEPSSRLGGGSGTAWRSPCSCWLCSAPRVSAAVRRRARAQPACSGTANSARTLSTFPAGRLVRSAPAAPAGNFPQSWSSPRALTVLRGTFTHSRSESGPRGTFVPGEDRSEAANPARCRRCGRERAGFGRRLRCGFCGALLHSQNRREDGQTRSGSETRPGLVQNFW